MKIVLLGYARGLISSRKIKQACQANVVFIALACGSRGAPQLKRIPSTILLLSHVKGANKNIYQYHRFGVELTNLSRRMTGKVDSEVGREIYPQRFAVAEAVFANIRTHKRLDRFTLRGQVKVNIQWLLYCMNQGHFIQGILQRFIPESPDHGEGGHVLPIADLLPLC